MGDAGVVGYRNCRSDNRKLSALCQGHVPHRMRGILEGKGGNLCYLRYIPKNADVQPDDLILASGLGGIYPRGMALGKVTKIDKKKAGIFQEIEVTPMVDFANLEEVLVVTAVTPRLQK